MPNNYPVYDELNITQYETVFGFYVLGFIQQHRPDIEIVDIRLRVNSWDCTHDLDNYDWLKPRIDQALAQGKKVAIIAEDEHVVFIANQQLIEILNQYVDAPVYWITMLDEPAYRMSYQQPYDVRLTQVHGFQLKILELPWMMLNECLTYYPVANTVTDYNTTDYDWVCLIGNTFLGYPDNHKLALAKELNRQGHKGLTVLSRSYPYPEEMLDYCKLNTEFIYTQNDPAYPPYARQLNLNGVWISKNVENYLTIDREYHSVPLAINPETVVQPFKSTEKSIWPILLGKLFLVYGRPGSMAWIQRFYDIDIERFARIDYDSIADPQERLIRMIQDNRELITNAQAVYQQLKPELEQARWTLGRNLYQYCLEQLERIV